MKDQNQKETTSTDKELKYDCKGLDNKQIKDVITELEKCNIKYDSAKKLEWQERKNIKVEDDDYRNVTTTISQKKLEEQMKREDKDSINKMYLENFDDLLKYGEDDFNNKVEEFLAKTNERLTKKGKKGKKGGAK